MKTSFITRAAILTVTIIMLLPYKQMSAIPAFARKYQISCQVCHTPVMPRLKAFGDDFAGDGFRMTEYESPRHFIQTGDDRLSLFRELPLAFRIDGHVTANFNGEGSVDFAAPFMLKILSGGELSDRLSYYFYFMLDERGRVAGLEDAFIMYKDLFRTGINIYLGQFAVSDPMFKGEMRYTIENYHIYATAPGQSSVNLKYDKGILLDKGFKTGTTVVFEVISGTGLGSADHWYVFDKDKYKNMLLKVTQDIGEYASLGFFGYTGKELLWTGTGDIVSSVKMYGPDLVLDFNEKLIIGLQYLWRTDSDVYLNPGQPVRKNVLTHGGFAEVIYSPKGDMSTWYLNGLLNWVESDLDMLDYRSATLHAGYIIRRNVRLVTEYTRVFSGNPYGKLSGGFVSAF
ncbi:MAG TPA: hypothetical protein PK005_05285 [Bacteroidales bacterium]|jgi:hypothetical protein|nr:hypothetical protein [Bacteroidales bacterium]MDI9532300.1 hypothetical protein [Bacteroidota bacterium]OPZ55004.1 MAG: hypothetical protein BWY89_01463 [Bacteroidetes bacterium ADurb.BinA012]MBP8708518.1 hypothetical protein [Bacteroidales bacterium]MZQ79548.1 hypothetical protein [Bacteroidales bacterium]